MISTYLVKVIIICPIPLVRTGQRLVVISSCRRVESSRSGSNNSRPANLTNWDSWAQRRGFYQPKQAYNTKYLGEKKSFTHQTNKPYNYAIILFRLYRYNAHLFLQHDCLRLHSGIDSSRFSTCSFGFGLETLPHTLPPPFFSSVSPPSLSPSYYPLSLSPSCIPR